MREQDDSQDWLERFRQCHRRNPRLLHIGNIANNAYVNAKILNDCGVDSDVLCYDYYHIMSHPEWESSPLRGDYGDDTYPSWRGVDLAGFERPRWFAQGPARLAIEYLLARRAGGCAEAEQKWHELTEAREAVCAQQREPPASAPAGRRPVRWAARLAPRPLKRLARHCLDRLALCRQRCRQRWQGRGLRRAIRSLLATCGQRLPARTQLPDPAFIRQFVDRSDRWTELLAGYDLVVGYCLDGIFPLVFRKRPYIAFEHGTIRSLPFEDADLGRLCKMVYQLADKVLITNCDNQRAAERLQLSNYSFLPHPTNEELAPQLDVEGLRRSLRRQLQADFILFHPARHHWEAERHPSWEKANDVLIRGFADFVRSSCPTAAIVFVNWGKTVAASRQLLAQHQIAERALWLEPLPNQHMLAHILATDATADQFFLGTFGGVTAKALMVGKPTLLYLEEEVHRWCFAAMPPVINVRTPQEVCRELTRLYRDEHWRRQVGQQGSDWYRQHYDNRLVARRMLEFVAELLPVPGGGQVSSRTSMNPAPLSACRS